MNQALVVRFWRHVLLAVGVLGLLGASFSGVSAQNVSSPPTTQAGNPVAAPPAPAPVPVAPKGTSLRLAAPTDPVLLDGPVAYWLLDDPSGSVATDSVGPPLVPHDGTYSGNVTPSAEGPRQGLIGSRQFAGGACDGVVVDPLVAQVTGDMAVEGWVKTTSSSGVLFRWRWYGYLLRVVGGKAVFESSNGSSSGFINGTVMTGSKVVNDGVWHHLAAVRTGDSPQKLLLYVDGVLDALATAPVSSTTTFYAAPVEAAIGRDGFACNGAIPSMTGNIAAVAIFDHALTNTQVAAHGGVGPIVPLARLAGTSAAPMGVLKTSATPPSVADPVNSATGGFDHVVTDLATPGRGSGLLLGRSYDSRQTGSSGFGVGWWHSYFESVSLNATSGVLSWRMPSGGSVDFQPDGLGGFLSPPGVLARVVVVAGGGWDLVRQDFVTDRFDATGRLVSRKDRSGQGVTLTYDGSGRVSVVTDSSARTLTFSYGITGSASGLLTQVRASDSRTVSYGYAVVPGALTAGMIRLSSTTDERGKLTSYTYDVNGFLRSQTDPLGHSEYTNTFDGLGRVVDQADALGKHSTFVYDDVAGVTTVTDAVGGVRSFSHPGNIPLSQTDPAGTSSMVFNAVLDVTSFTDATGKQWVATYDLRGNLLTRTSPAPLVFTETWGGYDSFNNPLSYTDPKGILTTYTYDGAGRLSTESRPAPGGVALTTNVWNSDGTLASTTDPRGSKTLYTYDVFGNVLSQTDPAGAKTTYTYDGAGRVLTTVEPRGNVAGAKAADYTTTYTYDAAGHVLTVKDALGRVTTNGYDDAGNLRTVTAADGGLTTYGYNSANELVTVLSPAPENGLTTFDYSDRGERIKQIDPAGGITTWVYDGAGRMVSMVEPRGNLAGGNPLDFTWTYGYDAVGRQTSVTDPTGRVTTTVFDALGRAATRTDPQGTTTYSYDPNGNVLSTDRTGIGVVSSTFDSLNRVATSTDARGKTTTYSYDLAGNLVSLVSPLGFKTTYTYDLAGRRKTQVDARGYVSGGVPASFTTTFDYDPAGNQIGVTNQLGQKTFSTFTRTGAVATVADPKGNTTTFTYDPLDRLKTVVAPLQGTTTYTYNTAGRLTARTDAKNHVTSYEFDPAGHLKKQTDPLGRFWSFDYDTNGNRIKTVNAIANAVTNPVLGSTTFTYDRANRVLVKDFSDSTVDIAYSYDSIGRVQSMTDAAGTETYGYDAAGRTTAVTRGPTGFTYGYDPNGNITSRTYPDGTQTSYGYDDDNRLATVTAGSQVTTYTYDPAGNVTKTLLPNGTAKTVGYDNAARVASINDAIGANPIASFAYTRDANGQPTQIVATGSNIAGTRKFTYDTANRLTQVCYVANNNCPAAEKTTWAYDTVGNRTSETVGILPTTTHTYDNADQLIASIVGATTTATYSYDANGNQTKAGNRVSTYNTAMQTVSIQDGTNPVTIYTYDGNSNRTNTTTGTTLTNYRWDTNASLPMLASETDGTGAVQRRYIYGLEPISLTTPTGTSFYLTDELGSTTHVTANTGAIQWAYTYTPYGTTKTGTKVDPSAPNNPLKYTGQYEDPTGNYNLRARIYNPTLGSFTQTDPTPMGPGSPFESAYVYGLNNPTVYTDPTGLRGQKSLIGIGRGAPDSLALIPEIAGGSCSGGRVDKVVDSFVSRRNGFLAAHYKKVKLLCGNDAFGYLHIFERQQHFGGVYDLAVRQAITFVLGYRLPRNDQGLLVYEQTQVCRQNGKNLFNFRIRVVVEPKQNFIVTAYIVKRENIDDPGERGNRDPRDYEPLGVQCPTTGF